MKFALLRFSSAEQRRHDLPSFFTLLSPPKANGGFVLAKAKELKREAPLTVIYPEMQGLARLIPIPTWTAEHPGLQNGVAGTQTLGSSFLARIEKKPIHGAVVQVS